MRSFAFPVVVIALLATPSLTSAQTRVSVYRGIGDYDVSLVDEGTVTALRLSRTVLPFLTLEAGAAHVELAEDFGGRADLYQPEVQAQLQLPLGIFKPYLGAGVGMAIARADAPNAETESEFTLNAGLGVRFDLPFGFGVGADARLRSIDPFTGSGADALIGVSYRF